jgi:hypothetical protein
MKISIWLVAVIVTIALWLLIPSAVWQYIFFARVPLIAAILLVSLPYFAQNQLAAMLKNLFVLRGRWQLTFAIVGAIMTGMAIALGAYAILLNASDRFDLPVKIVIPEWGQYVLAIVLGFPVCWTVYQLAEKNPVRIKISDRKVSVFLGVAISFGLLTIVAFTRKWLFENEVIKDFITQLISFFSRQETRGYIDANGELTRGHLSAIAFLIAGGITYGSIGLIFRPKAQSRRREAPALLYLMLLIGMLSLLLGGATFYLDYFRIPVLVLFIGISVTVYKLFNVDHFFQLDKLPTSEGNKGDFKHILDARLVHQKGERTLVIICASGGGIQAAGWTVQVLSGLQTLLGKSFSQAIGLISGVSGGSVGTMYYLDRIDETEGYPKTEELENIFTSATSDSLDAVGWGLAYLDLWRFIGLPFIIKSNYDRGSAIEKDWRGEMKKTNSIPTLNTWRQQVFRGKLPIPIFNATIVEDGRRFLISPVTFNQLPDPNYIDFNSLYPDYDMSVISAARLSATFPYVSPICRSSCSIAGKNFHFADGGYFDNSGFVTITEWLNEWLKTQNNLQIKRVLILQINPFPQAIASPESVKQEANDERKPKGKESKPGWFMATIGPLLAMYKVRDLILAERNKTQANLLIENWKDKVEIKYYPIFFPSSSELQQSEAQASGSEFFDSDGEYQPPLSWKLSDGQKAAIKAGWAAISNASATIKSAEVIQDLKKLWHDDWKMPAD